MIVRPLRFLARIEREARLQSDRGLRGRYGLLQGLCKERSDTGRHSEIKTGRRGR